MSKLVLLNDVSTDIDEANLLVGDTDPPCSLQGTKQAALVSSVFREKVGSVDLILSSDALRIKSLVHKIRADSKDQSLTSLTPRRMEVLRERSFGVLNQTPLSLGSDVFNHTRIKPEHGESVSECRIRIMKYIVDVVEKCRDKKILMVSHPFLCQIAFNAILQRSHTLVTKFWTQKGSFAVFNFEFGKYGVKWNLDYAHNAISNTSYTQDEVYSGILRKEGSLPG